MKGILRTARQCFSWVPLQFWVQAIGLALVILGHLGHLAIGTAGFPATALGVSVCLGLALVLLPVSFATGAAWRGICAPQALRLIPYARIRILLGVLLTIVVLSAFVSINVALLGLELPASRFAAVHLTTVFIDIVAAQTIAILLLFLLGSSPPWASAWWIVLLLIALAPRWLAQQQIVSAAIARFGAARLIALLLAGAWIAFAAWYLRVRRILAPAWGGVSVPGLYQGVRAGRNQHIQMSRRSAVTVYLLGLPSIASLVRRAFFALTGFALLGIVPLALGHPGARGVDPNLGDLCVFGLVFVLAFPAAFLASSIARRARTLWLPGLSSREQLFRICERLIWRCAAALGVPAAMLCAAVWIFLPHVATDWPYLAAAVLATSSCTMYLGLVSVRGWAVLDVVAAILIVVLGWGAAVMVPLFSGRAATPAMIAIVLAEAVGTLALRATAQRRWLRIDWFTFRPQRTPAQVLRPAA